ncbi:MULTISPECIES: mandelate racemase/muconate lactonizing enzyme family protein [unclassified Mycolicibacterium]|uniref:mandelate racemase/muconate lactonizing enzyme family protein n=1 Tax=unclassified Mycolicibacterium TaxID=2636767 RepID=UPI0012DF0ED3|nr:MULTISPECIES: mandelate racemase/muconate lactonizing enzyme family protein [unclassified Mycolicibacterium]
MSSNGSEHATEIDDRVHSINTYLVDSGTTKNWLFVQLRTENGLTGWGECYTAPDREHAIRAVTERLADHLIGASVFDIRRFTQMAYQDAATKRGSMEFFCAVSGIEQALWDVVGKTLDQPIYNLLGGATQDRIRVYANGWSFSPAGGLNPTESVLTAAEAMVEAGFDALKLDPFPGLWCPYPDKDDVIAGVELVGALRERLGASIDLLIEGHRRFAPRVAVRVAKLLEEFDPFWLEEPVPSSQLDGLAEVRSRTTIPIVTGEDLYTTTGFREVFERNAVDIINPDVCNCGGILELTNIAALAHANLVAVAPHNYNSTSVGLASTLQASATMPTFLITEYFVNFTRRSADISATPPITVNDGHIVLDERPGHGVELNEEALRHAEGDPVRRTFSLASPKEANIGY